MLTDVVQHRASDSDARVRGKTCAPGRIEIACRLEQPYHTRLHQIIDIHGRRQTRREMLCDAFDQFQVQNDQLFFRARRIGRYAR